MVNINNKLTERNKELLAKIQELENKEKTKISKEAQLKIIDKLNNWKKENIEVGDRLKEYESNTYPSFMKNGDWPIWKHLASNANFELLFTTYTSEEELTVDFIIEKMLNSILRQSVSIRSLEGLKEKHWEEINTLKQEIAKEKRQKRAFETVSLDYLKELVDKRIEVKDLNKELEEKKLAIKHLEEKLQHEKLKEQTHIEAFEVSERWNKNQKAELIKEYNDCVDLLNDADKEIDNKDEEISNLQKGLEEKSDLLDKTDKELEEQKAQNEELRRNKSLPKTPSKFKIFKEETKTKFKQFRQLIKKTKVQTQEFIARIEVKVN